MRTADYPHCWFAFDEWNPVQEKCLGMFTENCNMVVAASVASGKTAIAEAVMGYETEGGGLAVYVSPLKSIGAEKFAAWRRHPTFGERGVELLDGDHRCDADTLGRTGVVVTTVESLHMVLRRGDPWVDRTRVLVFDEAHMIGTEGRGVTCEGMLMDFTQLVPGARVVLLSGTVGNPEELARWLKTLSGRATRFVSSSWRPTRLDMDVEVSGGLTESLAYVERECVPGRKMMVFVHSRRLGEMLQRHLRRRGIQSVLFHAGMSMSRRESSLSKFRGRTDVIISTSSLGMGVTL